MNNPYTTPSSNLGGQIKQSRHVLWKVYFFIFLLVVLVDAIIRFSKPETDLNSVLSFMANLGITMGVFQYSFNRAFKFKWVWRLIFIAVMVDSAPQWYEIFTDSVLRSLIFVSIVGPAWFAFFSYAWRNEEGGSA